MKCIIFNSKLKEKLVLEMGCAASKRVDVATDVYRPPLSSFAVFDILSIEEPWLKSTNTVDDDDDDDGEKDEPEGTKHVPDRLLLEKLNAIEDASRTWEEVSKALEEIKPTLKNTPILPQITNPPPAAKVSVPANAEVSLARTKSSFRKLEELNEVKVSPKTQLNSAKPESIGSGSTGGSTKPVKENIFILRDRLEREKEGKPALFVKRDPLSDYPEICPPGGGSESVVLYTTSLGGVRRTFDDCNKLRSILEYHRVVFDERDVSLHGEFLVELKELLGEPVAVLPRMFVKGRYIGGVEEVVNLNETGRLGRLLSFARVERGVGRLGCEGCGGARFVPCLDCGGSCKVLVGVEKERCPSCNENGLVICPVCSI